MPRLTPYLGIVLALLVGAFVGVFANTARVAYAPTATTTPLFTLPEIAFPKITLPIAGPRATTTVATSAPKTSAPEKKVTTPSPTQPAATTTPVASTMPVAAPLPTSGAPIDAVVAPLNDALVNIICYVPIGSALHSISGSGVFVDSKGIIVTNAHIAQYFLLADRGARCTIRTGSPAHDAYKAALIYISPYWVRANASVVTQSEPTGTGEYDFAFLAVTGSATSQPLPSSFPAIPLATTPPAADTPVVIGSYGAQFLASSQVQSALFPTLVFGSVKAVFTFDTNTVDVLALGGSAAAQEGSSGGGVATADGKLSGVITTSTVTGETSTRQLNAITASYIRAEYASEMSSALDLLLNQDPSFSVADFAPQIPALEALITANL